MQSLLTPIVMMTSPPLNDIRIANPCSADWNGMQGSERVRHCSDCKLNVYNLSALSRADASRLVQETEGRTCVRFYRRLDGTILTKDCPDIVDIPRERRNAAMYGLAFAVMLVVLNPINTAVWNIVEDVIESASHAEYGGGEVMGEMVPPEFMPIIEAR